MASKFPSLSSFLDSTKKIEHNTMETALNNGTEQEVQKILSESAIRLSVYNQTTEVKTDQADLSTSEFIQQGIKEAMILNSTRVKSILDELFSNLQIAKEREEFWVHKLCSLFNIDKSFSIEEKYALIEKQLAEDDDTLNYVTYLVESGEKKVRG